MRAMLVSFFVLLGFDAFSQTPEPQAEVERTVVDYKGKTKKARRLSVSSEIPMPLEKAWRNVKTPALLQFVAKGMITFKPVGEPLPEQWEEGQTVKVKMRIFGFLPFGGIHHLYVEEIDEDNHKISTHEWDRSAKVWNHDIVLRDLGDGRIYYEDSITIYGGFLTGFITAFARKFYKHRQRRWQIVAEQQMDFSK